MTLAYNPIVRTFCRVRSVLVTTLGVERRQVRPATPLESLIPAERLREVLTRLREAELPARDLERQLLDFPLCGLAILGIPLCLFLPIVLQSVWVALVTVPLALELGWLSWAVQRTRVVHVPLGAKTVGDLVIALTRFSEHPGYHFSRNEVGLKVRFLVSEYMGVPVDQIQEKTSFTEMGE